MSFFVRIGFIFSLLHFASAMAQFEFEIGNQNAWVADSPAPKKSFSLDLNSRCTPESIANIEETEKCVGMAKPDSCYFVATSQLQANRNGQVAAAGMLGLALLSPSTAQAAIKDHQKIRQAILVKKSVEREFKRFAKRYIQQRIALESEFNHYNNRGIDVKRHPGEGDLSFLRRLQEDNAKSFPKIERTQLAYLKEDAGGHSILSWEELSRHQEARALRNVIEEDRKLPSQSREIFEASQDPRIKDVIERLGSRNPEALLQAFAEIESKKVSELQSEFLGDALVNRRNEAQERLELLQREAAEKADPNFQKESKAAIENLANKRKELAAAQKDGGPMKILMAKSSFDQAHRELWRRIDQNAERVTAAMANLRTQSAAVQPALNSLLNFDGTTQQLEIIHARLETELKSHGILAESGFTAVNPLGVENSRQELESLKEKRRREVNWKKAKDRMRAAAPVATLGLSLAAAPGLGIAKSAKIKSCAESLKLSDIELDFLLLHNPHLALLDRCEDLKIQNLGDLANASSRIDFMFLNRSA